MSTLITRIPEDVRWISIGSLQSSHGDDIICTNSHEYLQHTRRSTKDSWFVWNWPEISSTIRHIHFAEEQKNLSNFVTHNVTTIGRHDSCYTLQHCTGPAGVRKLIVRTDLSPLEIKIHTAASHLVDAGRVMAIDEIYIRHHRCLNAVDKHIAVSKRKSGGKNITPSDPITQPVMPESLPSSTEG